MTKSCKIRKPLVGRRPKALHANMDTRASVLSAARSVFALRGFDGTSTREVAEAAGVNNAMIYYHFKDKVELYRAVLADSFAALDRVWEHEIFQTSSTAREKVAKYVEEFIRFQHANEELRKIMSMEFAACSENCKWVADNFFKRSYSRLADIFKQGVRAGELKKTDPAAAIAVLIGMIIHSFIMRPIAEYITGKDLDLSVKRFGAFVTGLFFDGLGPEHTDKKQRLKHGSMG